MTDKTHRKAGTGDIYLPILLKLRDDRGYELIVERLA
jgi:hypothetical protein